MQWNQHCNVGCPCTPADGGVAGMVGGRWGESYGQSLANTLTLSGGTAFLTLSGSSHSPSSLLCDHGPDPAAEDQVHGAGAGREHHPGAAVVVGDASGHRPTAAGPPVPPGAVPCCPDHPEL